MMVEERVGSLRSVGLRRGGCICYLSALLLMRTLTKRPTINSNSKTIFEKYSIFLSFLKTFSPEASLSALHRL